MNTTFDSISAGFRKTSNTFSIDGLNLDISVFTYNVTISGLGGCTHDMTKLFFFGDNTKNQMLVSYSPNPTTTVTKRVRQLFLQDKCALYFANPRDFVYTRHIDPDLVLIGGTDSDPVFKELTSFINDIAYSKYCSEYEIGPANGWMRLVADKYSCMVNIAQYVCGNLQIVGYNDGIISHRLFKLQQDGELSATATVVRCFDGYFIETKNGKTITCVRIRPDTTLAINMYTVLPDEQPRIYIERAVSFQLNGILRAAGDAFSKTEFSTLVNDDGTDEDIELNFEADLIYSQQNTNPYI